MYDIADRTWLKIVATAERVGDRQQWRGLVEHVVNPSSNYGTIHYMTFV